MCIRDSLYTAKQNEAGEFIYVVDGLPSDAEDFRFAGDPIEPEIKGDMQRALDGEVVLPDNIKKTDWGKIFITYVPIHDGERVVGVLGIEFEAEHQYNTYRNLRLATPLIVLFACLVSAGLALVFFRRVSNPTFQDMANTCLLYTSYQHLHPSRPQARGCLLYTSSGAGAAAVCSPKRGSFRCRRRSRRAARRLTARCSRSRPKG